MKRLRWILPCGHLLIDTILFLELSAQISGPAIRGKGIAPPLPFIQPALFVLEGNSVGFDFQLYDFRPYALIITGNLPAGLLSESLMPETRRARGGLPLARWFLLHETLALAFWFLLGRRLDSGNSPLRNAMLAYLALRALLAIFRFYDPGWRIQSLLWFIATLWFVGAAIHFGVLWASGQHKKE